MNTLLVVFCLSSPCAVVFEVPRALLGGSPCLLSTGIGLTLKKPISLPLLQLGTVSTQRLLLPLANATGLFGRAGSFTRATAATASLYPAAWCAPQCRCRARLAGSLARLLTQARVDTVTQFTTLPYMFTIHSIMLLHYCILINCKRFPRKCDAKDARSTVQAPTMLS